MTQAKEGRWVSYEDYERLRARVAILDAQEVTLPELSPIYELHALGHAHGATADGAVDRGRWIERERQLLDARRAVQACREVAQQLRILFNDGARIEEDGWPVGTDAALSAYDALARKDGE